MFDTIEIRSNPNIQFLSITTFDLKRCDFIRSSSSNICAVCRTKKKSSNRKVYLNGFDKKTPDTQINQVLKTTNAYLTRKLTEKDNENNRLGVECAVYGRQIQLLDRQRNEEKLRTRRLQSALTERNETIRLKDLRIRALEIQVGSLIKEYNELKKDNNKITEQLKNQKALEENMKRISAENKRLQRQIPNTQPTTSNQRWYIFGRKKIKSEMLE